MDIREVRDVVVNEPAFMVHLILSANPCYEKRPGHAWDVRLVPAQEARDRIDIARGIREEA